MGVPGADAATAAFAKGSWETLMRTYETSVRQEKYVPKKAGARPARAPAAAPLEDGTNTQLAAAPAAGAQ